MPAATQRTQNRQEIVRVESLYKDHLQEVFPSVQRKPLLAGIFKALLLRNNKPTHPTELAGSIKSNKLAPLSGSTPEATVRAALSVFTRDFKDQEIFLKVKSSNKTAKTCWLLNEGNPIIKESLSKLREGQLTNKENKERQSIVNNIVRSDCQLSNESGNFSPQTPPPTSTDLGQSYYRTFNKPATAGTCTLSSNKDFQTHNNELLTIAETYNLLQTPSRKSIPGLYPNEQQRLKDETNCGTKPQVSLEMQSMPLILEREVTEEPPPLSPCLSDKDENELTTNGSIASSPPGDDFFFEASDFRLLNIDDYMRQMDHFSSEVETHHEWDAVADFNTYFPKDSDQFSEIAVVLNQ